MKMASSFCSSISCWALSIRARRSSSLIGTTPVVIGVSPLRNAGGSAAAGTAAVGSGAGAHPAARAPAPSAEVERNWRRDTDKLHLRGTGLFSTETTVLGTGLGRESTRGLSPKHPFLWKTDPSPSVPPRPNLPLLRYVGCPGPSLEARFDQAHFEFV